MGLFDKYFGKIVLSFVLVLIPLYFLVTIFWLARLVNLLLISKRIHRRQLTDICDSIVRKRVVYNYTTITTNTVILLAILVIEFILHACIVVIFHIINKEKHSSYFKQNNLPSQTNAYLVKCNASRLAIELYDDKYLIFLVSLGMIQSILIMLLLAYLCRYLSQRYLNLPHSRAIKLYSVWFLMQTVLLVACSTIYTVLAGIILIPVLFTVNWVLLMKDSRRLSRVLKSKLQEILNFEYDKVRYNSLMRAKEQYIIFINPISIAFLLIVLMVFYNALRALHELLLVGEFCFLALIYHGAPPSIKLNNNVIQNIHATIKIIDTYVAPIIALITEMLLLGPIIIYTISVIVQLIVARLTKNSRRYRYNYQIIKPLIQNGQV